MAADAEAEIRGAHAKSDLEDLVAAYGMDSILAAVEAIKAAASTTEPEADDGTSVTAWQVVGKIDSAKLLDKMIKKFGCSPIDAALMERMERLTGQPPHLWLQRGIVFAHRDLHDILDKYEAGIPFYLYTGRGPSSGSLHLGHLISYIFTAELQKLFNVPVVIQISDDEKVSFRGVSWDDMAVMMHENVKDLIACGFDPEKTFIFSNRDFSSDFAYKMVYRDVANSINLNTLMKVFGLTRGSNVGSVDWTVWQTVPSFAKSFSSIFAGRDMQCLIVYGIDQDPYFRIARDFAVKNGLHKPAGLICSFLPPLTGDGKMSSSDANAPTLFVTLPEAKLRETIRKHCFSGGQEGLENHRRLGADLDADMAVKYLNFFCPDSARIAEIRRLYGPGELGPGEERMPSGAVKDEMATHVIAIIRKHQELREAATDAVVARFFEHRSLEVRSMREHSLRAQLAGFLPDAPIVYHYHRIVKDKATAEARAVMLDGAVYATHKLYRVAGSGALVLALKAPASKPKDYDARIAALTGRLGGGALEAPDADAYTLLNVAPAAVSLLSLVNDTDRRVRVFADPALGLAAGDGRFAFAAGVADCSAVLTGAAVRALMTGCEHAIEVLE